MRIKAALIFLFILTLCACQSKEDLLGKGRKLIKQKEVKTAVIYLKKALDKDPDYTGAKIELARAYGLLGKPDSAQDELNGVLKADPADKEARLELARTYLEQSKPDQAFAELKKLPVSLSKDPRFLQETGWAYAIRGDYQTALSYLVNSVQAGGDGAETEGLIAQVYFKMGDMARAKEKLNEVLEKDPGNANAIELLASAQLREKDLEGAIATYSRAGRLNVNASFKKGMLLLEKGRSDQAGQTADDLISRFPRRPEGYALKGVQLYDLKRYNDAEVSLRKSLEYGQSPLTHYYLGLCLFNTNDMEQALSELDGAARVDPSIVQARNMGALILMKQNRTDEAIRELKDLAATGREDAATHDLLGNAYMSKGMKTEATEEFSRAKAMDPSSVISQASEGRASEGSPEDVRILMMLGDFHMRKKDYSAAEEEYGRAEKLAPAFADAAYRRAVALDAAGKYGEAMAEYQKTLATDPGYLAALNNLAYLELVRGGDCASALLLAARASALAPQNGGVLDTYGLALLKNGKAPEALMALERSNLLMPGNPEVLYHLALAYLAAGNKKSSVADLKKCLSMGDFPETGQARELLSRLER